MDHSNNPLDVSGLNMVVPGPQDVGLDMLRSDPQDDDLNMVLPESQDDHLYMVMPQDDHLNMVDPLDNGLDPAVAKAMVATSECHSFMPLIKLELNTKIKLRRPNLTVSSQPKPPPEMTAGEMDKREKVKKKNKHHATMSRIRKKEREQLLQEEIAGYETENALLKDEIANSRGQIQVLEDVLRRHECLLRPPRDTPPT
ncbi:uncharacterized protein LOC124284189 isoform X2 [Haliotis rubra]|uniref:uncharacterized protein LOC124284189 isoform X2 n=1 Tax=Haliotis rubra TaxID=36100 RepID=UPI001EE6123A|nr:uncharacterized protein LOC124284189 isoform X2 [Haliotis rubra]